MNEEFKQLNKRKIRYWCFRFRTEAEGGVTSKEAPKGLREYFENIEWFGSWKNFGVTWDVKEESPFEIKPLVSSIEDDWNKTITEEAKDLPVLKPKKTRKRKK